MNNFGGTITPADAKKFGDEHGDKHSLSWWQKLANRKAGKCEVCGEDEWKFGRVGMCFTCTTGEADASEDLEIAP